MGKFVGELILKALPDGRTWELMQPFQYDDIAVQRGFQCDFASIPRVFWRLIGPPATGKYRRAAIIHDWLYRHGSRFGYSREEADRIFYEAMRVDGVSWLKAKTIYTGVRLGGWAAWNS